MKTTQTHAILKLKHFNGVYLIQTFYSIFNTSAFGVRRQAETEDGADSMNECQGRNGKLVFLPEVMFHLITTEVNIATLECL